MKRKKLYIAILLLAGVLTSCKVGKSYVRPDLHLPDSLERSQDSVSFGDQDWRDIYTDATLRSLIERALDHNKDMLIAAARVKEMAAQKRISTAALLPDIKGKVTGERELENHGGDAFKRSDTFEAQFLVSWEVDLWGNLRWARSASIAEYLQSIEAQRALQMTIVAEVAQAYYELVALDTELDIVKQTLKAREEGVRLARIRFAGGLTSETSYRQAQVELARTATLVPDLERKISLKENDIAYLAGEYPNKIARSRLLQEFNSPETLPVGLPSTLLERRPDIRQAEQKLIAANAKVGVAYTNMFPRLALTGGFGSESTSLSELLKSPYAVMEGALLTPIFGWGKNRAALKAKKAAYEAEVHSYEKSVLEAFKETRNAIVNFNKIKEVYELRANLERSAKSYMDLAQLQYINGHHERFAPHDGGCLHRGRRPHAGRDTGGKGRRPRGTAGFDAAGGERVREPASAGGRAKGGAAPVQRLPYQPLPGGRRPLPCPQCRGAVPGPCEHHRRRAQGRKTLCREKRKGLNIHADLFTACAACAGRCPRLCCGNGLF